MRDTDSTTVGPADVAPDEGKLRAALDAARRNLAEAEAERDALLVEAREARKRERALGDAVQHRLRNMLATIRSVIRRTLEADGSKEDAIEHLDGRVAAVARYQRTTPNGLPCPVELEDMLRDELLSTHCLDRPGLTLSGPPVAVEGEAQVPLALAIHELATNSLKYGALPQEGGSVGISWSVSHEAAGQRLRLDWVERGVSLSGAATDARGFGRQYLEDGLAYQLGATTNFELLPDGVRCRIDVPLQHLRAARG